MQSPSEAQTVLHADVPQRYGSHAATVGAAQLPTPSQNAALVPVPPVQEAVPHIVPCAVWAQLPSDAQVPVLPQAPLGAQRPCGSAAPAPTEVQVPALPMTLQAWHCGQAAAV